MNEKEDKKRDKNCNNDDYFAKVKIKTRNRKTLRKDTHLREDDFEKKKTRCFTKRM